MMRERKVPFYLNPGECAFLLCIIGIETEEKYPDDYDMRYETKGYSGESVFRYLSADECMFYIDKGYFKNTNAYGYAAKAERTPFSIF